METQNTPYFIPCDEVQKQRDVNKQVRDLVPEPLCGVSHTRLLQPVTEDDTEQIPALPSSANFAPAPNI